MTEYTVCYETDNKRGTNKILSTYIESSSPDEAYAKFIKIQKRNLPVYVSWKGGNSKRYVGHIAVEQSSSGVPSEQQLLQQILVEQKKSNFRLSVIACPAWILLVNYLFSYFSSL